MGFHRVMPLEKFDRAPYIHADLAVTTNFFEMLLSFLSQQSRALSIDNLKSDCPENTFVVSFDDFYTDVLLFALPILEKYSIPAIVYACTDFLDRQPLLWWYGTDAFVHKSDSVDFTFKGTRFVGSLLTPKQKLGFVRRLNNFCALLKSEEQLDFIKTLGVFEDCLLTDALPDWAMVRDLARHPLITIGAHTVSHVALSRLSDADAYWQMQESKKRLEAKIGIPVKHFAFPFGGADSCGEREFAFAKEIGFETAVTTLHGPNRVTMSPFALRRSVVLQQHGMPGIRSLNSGWEYFLRHCRERARNLKKMLGYGSS